MPLGCWALTRNLIWSRASRKRFGFIETSEVCSSLLGRDGPDQARISRISHFKERLNGSISWNCQIVQTIQVRITGLTILPPPGQMLGLPSWVGGMKIFQWRNAEWHVALGKVKQTLVHIGLMPGTENNDLV